MEGWLWSCLTLWLLFLPPSYLTVVQVWVEIWGWVGVGGFSPSHHPLCAGLGLAGEATLQHCPRQEMWSSFLLILWLSLELCCVPPCASVLHRGECVPGARACCAVSVLGSGWQLVVADPAAATSLLLLTPTGAKPF